MNRATITGNLGTDVEIRQTKSGTPVANFSVATSEYGKDADGNKTEHTEWHSVVVFGRQAETCAEYLAKGRKVLVDGSIRTRSWDKDDGSKAYRTEILANSVEFLSSPQG